MKQIKRIIQAIQEIRSEYWSGTVVSTIDSNHLLYFSGLV